MWADCQLISFPVASRWSEMSTPEARTTFDYVMEQRRFRVAQLGELVERNGHKFGTDDADIQEVNDFFRLNVEVSTEPAARGYPKPEWGSVSYDIGLYLGEVLIERHPHLRWKLDLAKKSVSANQPVFVGFEKVAVKGFKNPDFGRFISYGRQIVSPPVELVEVQGRWVDAQTRYLEELGVADFLDELALEFDAGRRPLASRSWVRHEHPALTQSCAEIDAALKSATLGWRFSDAGSREWQDIRALSQRASTHLQRAQTP
jgi:hypothetical protein